MKCFVTFRLRPDVTPEQYLDWFRRENVPAVREVRSIKSYHVWRVSRVLDGQPGFEFLEEMELEDRAAFEREIDELPSMKAMLDGWYSRVADQVVVFAEEVEQE